MFENLKKLVTEKNLKIGFAILVLVIVIMSLKKMGLYEGMEAPKAEAPKAEAPKAETAPMKSTEKKIALSIS
jgi:Na+-transporting methylmalonyl-CoA/oxaloacetate decarboxylase gamma subunit